MVNFDLSPFRSTGSVVMLLIFCIRLSGPRTMISEGTTSGSPIISYPGSSGPKDGTTFTFLSLSLSISISISAGLMPVTCTSLGGIICKTNLEKKDLLPVSNWIEAPEGIANQVLGK